MIHSIGPSSPIIEDLKPIPNGLNISWKSDVKTRQDKFEVTYNRNDTGKLMQIFSLCRREFSGSFDAYFHDPNMLKMNTNKMHDV
jgi:hypothetical protein